MRTTDSLGKGGCWGLKLELKKRLDPVLVIDHFEPQPTEIDTTQRARHCD